MKITALVILIIGTLMLIGLGYIAILFLALSFEPWTKADTITQVIRVGVVVMFVGFLAMIVYGWRAFYLGKYAQITPFAYVFFGYLVLVLIFNFGIQFGNRNNVNVVMSVDANNPEDSTQIMDNNAIPTMFFFRKIGTSKDTLTVQPNGLVTYHLVIEGKPDVKAIVGQFNPSRDLFRVNWQGEGKLSKEAYDQFVNDQGEAFSHMFNIR